MLKDLKYFFNQAPFLSVGQTARSNSPIRRGASRMGMNRNSFSLFDHRRAELTEPSGQNCAPTLKYQRCVNWSVDLMPESGQA